MKTLIDSFGRKIQDLTNIQFDRLTAIKPVGKNKHNKTLWLCRCNCGKEIVTSVGSLKKGHTRSCGCLHKELIKSSRTNKVGKKFYRLLVLEDTGKNTEDGNAILLCKCDCGKIKEVNSRQLYNGGTKSCGCLLMESRKNSRGENNHNYTGYKELTGRHYGGIKMAARKRKREFKISKEEIYDLFLKQNRKCALTGLDISLEGDGYKTGTASLDRIDSNKGYINGNLQWLHKDINRIKSDFPQETFLEYCRLVASHNYQSHPPIKGEMST
jgi:hypothetical protein